MRLVLDGDLSATLHNRGAASAAVTYTYINASAVAISSLTPAFGPMHGGTPVTIRGAGLTQYGYVYIYKDHT